MAFVFTLQGPLRVREMQEKAALQVLQAIAAQIAGVRAEIENLSSIVDSLRREAQGESGSDMSAAELHFLNVREAVLTARGRALAEKLRQLEEARAKQQTRYLQARQHREVLSSLRDEQKVAYELEQSRRAQRATDDLFLMRLLANRGE